MMGSRGCRLHGWVLVMICLTTTVGFDEEPGLVDGVSAATRPGLSVVGLIRSDFEGLANPAPPDATLTEAQVAAMVRHAVDMAGGLAYRIPQDAEWVVIKVNIVELREQGSGVITDWRVVKALIQIVAETVPGVRITIAEGPAEWIPPDSPEVQVRADVERADGFAIAGYRQLLQDPDLKGIHLDILDLNFDEVAEVSVPDGGYARDKWTLPLAILENDFLITVPVLKVHNQINMTNAMKNFIGVFPGMVYGWPKLAGYPPRSGNPGIPHNTEIIDETIADVIAATEPDFALVDAIMCMERAKTDKFGGHPRRLNMIVASADVVAADAISAQLIGMNPADLEYLTLASHKGLGQSDPRMIKVKGSPLAQVAVRFEKASKDDGAGHYGQGNRTWLLQGPFDKEQLQAGEELIDITNPAVHAGQDGWSAGVYFHDDRIDLDKHFDDPAECVVYAYAQFEAVKAQSAELWLGSDEGMKVWINGALVYEYEGRRRHRLPNDRKPVQIHAGSNTVVVRAEQNRGGYDFSLNICEPETDPRYDGNRVAGLLFSLPAGPIQEQEHNHE